MVERIRTLLETRQLTPTQFADAIGIARPIVSHVLSGRNKPSLEVVQRILAAMPDLSMAWLLNGTGPMLAAVTAVPVATPAPPPVPQGQSPDNKAPVAANALLPGPAIIPSSPIAQARQNAPVSRSGPTSAATAAPRPVPKRFAPLVSKPVFTTPIGSPEPLPLPAQEVDHAAAPAPEPKVITAPEMAVPALDAAVNNSFAPVAVIPAAAALFAETEKPIRRIVIFYRDGSFADYQPE